MPIAKLAEITLAYETHGVATTPAIVLIRGLGTQLIDWPTEFIDKLVQGGLRVVTFDNRDAGLSSKVEDGTYTLGDMAADVVGLLDHLGIEAVHVFGISLGGMIAQHLAFSHPDRVSTLFSVMSSSGSPELPRPAPEIMALLVETADGADAIIELNARGRAVFGSPAYPETLAIRMAAARRAYERCNCPAGVARQMQAALSDGDRSDRLATIKVPTMVIHGKADPLIPWQAGEHTAQQIPGARLELIDGMGHNIPLELTAPIAALVTGFISDNS
jgi:pimeloyl-ACP methyl ester carboxylesterase